MFEYDGAQYKQEAFAGLVCSYLYIFCWHGVIGRAGAAMVGLKVNVLIFANWIGSRRSWFVR
jgi:hypothetical protein